MLTLVHLKVEILEAQLQPLGTLIHMTQRSGLVASLCKFRSSQHCIGRLNQGQQFIFDFGEILLKQRSNHLKGTNRNLSTNSAYVVYNDGFEISKVVCKITLKFLQTTNIKG